INEIPVGQNNLLNTLDSVGYDSTNLSLGFDGQTVTKTLTLSTLARVRGRVLMPDQYTPVAGATVTINDNVQETNVSTGLDGSFEFKNVTPNAGYRVVANYPQNGIRRTAYTTGSTPKNGGPSDPITLVLLKQGSVEGTIVDANNQPIQFAKLWMRELSFPYETLGSAQAPLTTDQNGHFR